MAVTKYLKRNEVMEEEVILTHIMVGKAKVVRAASSMAPIRMKRKGNAGTHVFSFFFRLGTQTKGCFYPHL